MKKRIIDNAKALALHHLRNKTGSAGLARYVLALLEALQRASSVRRISLKGRDVTDDQSAWSETDVRSFVVTVPNQCFEELEAAARRSRSTVAKTASLTLLLGQREGRGGRESA